MCVFITAVPITKLFAWGEGDSGGHVLREMTSRGDAESVRRRRPGQERSGRRGSQDISKYWLVDRLVDRGRRWQGKRLAERCEHLGGNGDVR